MSVTRRGTKWQVRVRDLNGEWFPSETFETKTEARTRETELLMVRDKGAKRGIRSARETTFQDYWESWADDHRQDMSLGWKISQDQMMRDHIMPVLRAKTLVDIERSDILNVLKKARDKGLGGQMRLHLFNMLHKMFFDAIEHYEILDVSPVRRAMKPLVSKTVRSFMKPDEARRFLAYVADDYIGPAIWIMMWCGLRIGELQALQWKNVDLNAGVLFVARQWQRKEKQFKLPKNGEPIRVPMPPDLIAYLAARRPLDYSPNGLVMANQKGELVHYDTIEDGLKRLCKAGNFTVLTPHELRHSCSEIWIDSGATKEDIRRLFNHKSESSTNPYIHRTEDRLERLSQGLTLGKAEKGLRVVK